MEDAIADLTREPAPVRNPITGENLTEPPAGVKTGTWHAIDHIEPEAARKILHDQRRQVIQLARIFEFRQRRELGPLNSHRISHSMKKEDQEEKK